MPEKLKKKHEQNNIRQEHVFEFTLSQIH